MVLATRDRDSILDRTLEEFAALDRTGLAVEFVVVDNGSRDETPQVLAAFTKRLPLVVLREREAGKCRSLNRALDQARLGDLVVFTDDDVSPARDWLQVVAASSERWPQASVFGGRIVPRWPANVPLPAWTRDEVVQGFGYAIHDLGAQEEEYPQARVPLGPNFWVRTEVLANTRFDERIGPTAGDRTLADETSFLRGLRARGLGLVYVPTAVVEHRIGPEAITAPFILSRAEHYGKGLARTRPLPQGRLLERLPLVWYLRRRLATARHWLLVALSNATLSRDRRVARGVRARIGLAFNLEALRLARARRG